MKLIKLIIIAGLTLTQSAPAGVLLKECTVEPQEICLGDNIEVRGTLQTSAKIAAVVVLSQQQADNFRKKVKLGDGLTEDSRNSYSFSVSLPTQRKGSAVELGEHMLRLVLLDSSENKIDNLPLKSVIIKETATEPQEGKKASLLEEEFKQIKQIAKATRLPDYYTADDLLTGGKLPDWLHSDAGTADVVLPPWTPVVMDELRISVWNRIYALGKSGLPESVLAGGKPLLQAPIRYVLRVDGKEFSGSYTNRVVEKKETGINLIFEAQAGGISIRTKAGVEYDGLCQFNTELIPEREGSAVDEFYLEIPVRSDRVDYYTHSVLGTFQPQKKDNPDLYILSLGGSGKLAEGKKVLPWTPQISLIGKQSGLCVGFLNDRSWQGPENKMVEILTEKDAVTVRARLIAEKTSLKKPAVYNWYLQALPARPILPWDEYEQFHSHQEKNAEVYLNHFKETDGTALIDKAVAEGLKTIIVHQDWTELQGHLRTYQPERGRVLRAVVDAAHKKGLKVVLYAGTELSAASPEWEAYADEILKIPLWKARPRTDPEADSYRPCSNKYYNDMLVHRMREAIRKYDIDGIFLDGHPNMGLCMNVRHGHGYIKENGEAAGTSYALDSRDLMRRIYTLFKHECKKDGLVIGHGGLYTPSFGFMDINLVGETEVYARKINPSLKLQELMSLGHFEANYNPLTYGVLPLWMSKSYQGGLTYDENSAVTLAFGVMPRVAYFELAAGAWDAGFEKFVDLSKRSHNVWKLFRAFDPGNAIHIPYWDTVRYFTLSPALDELHVASMYLIKGKRAMVIVSNLSENGKTIELSFDSKALGFVKEMKASDPESGKELAMSNGRLKVEVPGGNYRLILLNAE